MKQLISMIAAIGENRELGKDGKLLWHISEDLKRFKKLTENHAVIMGRVTYDSLNPKWKPLPNRANIIVTKDKNLYIIGCVVTHSVTEAIEVAQSERIQSKYRGEIFIIGGGQIYKQGIQYADKLYLTVVKGAYQADTYFPDYSEFSIIQDKETISNKDYFLTFLKLLKSR